VQRIVNALREEYRDRVLPIDVWIDRFEPRPGEHWEQSIKKALLDSLSLLIFVSHASMNSEWVRAELNVAVAATDRLILERVPDLPLAIQQIQWLVSSRLTPTVIRDAAAKIADATLICRKTAVLPPIGYAEASNLAKSLAREVTGMSLLKAALLPIRHSSSTVTTKKPYGSYVTFSRNSRSRRLSYLGRSAPLSRSFRSFSSHRGNRSLR
jgi:hypothetical protein